MCIHSFIHSKHIGKRIVLLFFLFSSLLFLFSLLFHFSWLFYFFRNIYFIHDGNCLNYTEKSPSLFFAMITEMSLIVLGRPIGRKKGISIIQSKNVPDDIRSFYFARVKHNATFGEISLSMVDLHLSSCIHP